MTARRSRTAVVVLVAALTAVAWMAVPAPPASDAVGPARIEVLSNRADLIAGGDALVEVVLPPGVDPAELRVDVDGRDVSHAFAPRQDGRIVGILEGLDLGENVVTARVLGGGARITITNHPIGGPVVAGPQIQPWTCAEGAQDDQCNRPPRHQWHYKSTAGGPLRPYDPQNPPPDVATTTTDEGEEVPFIVREEIGVIDRDEYRIAVLYDPDEPWEPWDPQRGFNGKLLITHGQSCDTHYEMGSAPGVRNETALSRGFGVLSHALDNAGHNCNIATQAESLIMTKEHFVETYGELRYTIGTGCSGGGLVQYQVANAYPGVYQGITPACSYPDAWSSAMQYVDYELLRRYFEDPSRWSVPWTTPQMNAVYGHPNPTNPVTFTEVIPGSGDPSRSCPGVPDEDVYDEETNPEGVRCTLQDYMVSVFGRRPPSEWSANEQLLGHGFANRPWDNVGVQYGFEVLLDGTLLPSQFVDLNWRIGASDYDYVETRERTEGSAIDIVYRSGANNTASNLDEVAIIDLRGPDPGAFHDVYRTYALRERLIREHGHADNQIIWRGSVPLIGDVTFTNEAILAMDEWLAAIEADERDVPLAQKIVEDRPDSVDHRCTDGAGADVPAAYCDGAVEAYSTPRIEAGMPVTDDVQKCALKPLDPADYPGVAFTDEEWAKLEAAFPTGVCDYAREGVDVSDTVPWLTYNDGPGGRPLGDPPQSIAFGDLGGDARGAAGEAGDASAAGEAGAAGAAASSGGFLPSTGGGAGAVGLAVAALLGAVALRRR